MNKQILRQTIESVLDSQRLAVLSTWSGQSTYSTLIAFNPSRDLTTIDFITGIQTRKYTHLQSNPRVSMLIDTRTNEASDFRDAVAITCIGSASHVEKTTDRLNAFLARFPFLEDYACSPGYALLSLAVERYVIVSQFQRVFDYEITDDRQ